MKTLAKMHGRLVHSRRVRRLAGGIARWLEPTWSLADIGCGDGRLGALIQELAPRVKVTGYEVLQRGETHIPVTVFDGQRIPAEDNSVDAALLSDVLHHTDDPLILLREAARVARRAVIIKDHRTSRPLAKPVLRFMDWIGNRPHGVALPYNYWAETQWRSAWNDLGLRVEQFETDLGLYPWPANWAFESGLHILVMLRPESNNVQQRRAA